MLPVHLATYLQRLMLVQAAAVQKHETDWNPGTQTGTHTQSHDTVQIGHNGNQKTRLDPMQNGCMTVTGRAAQTGRQADAWTPYETDLWRSQAELHT